MLKNKPLHITYIGRLEKEKGIEIIIDCIRRARQEERDIIWHICGEGSYIGELRALNGEPGTENIQIHGHLSRSELDKILAQTDLVIMPSLFLETFGLVALECIDRGVAVCGIAQGGLKDFIHPDLEIDPDHPVDSFFSILDGGNFPLSDISDFSYSEWISHLENLTQGYQKILIVSDYLTPVGGAEQYIIDLTIALRSLGKSVEQHGYVRSVSRMMRIWLFLLSPIAYWRGKELDKKIQIYQPDLIWMHQISRYIGPHGVGAILDTGCPIYLTHHDLGLVSPRPSQVYRESDIPDASLGGWISRSTGIISILVYTFKWLYVSWIWQKSKIIEMYPPEDKNYGNVSSGGQKSKIIHLLPSLWMRSYFERYTIDQIEIFPHTSK